MSLLPAETGGRGSRRFVRQMDRAPQALWALSWAEVSAGRGCGGETFKLPPGCWWLPCAVTFEVQYLGIRSQPPWRHMKAAWLEPSAPHPPPPPPPLFPAPPAQKMLQRLSAETLRRTHPLPPLSTPQSQLGSRTPPPLPLQPLLSSPNLCPLLCGKAAVSPARSREGGLETWAVSGQLGVGAARGQSLRTGER